MSDKLNSISNELLNKNLKACSNEECYEVIKEYVARLEALREREDKYLQSKLPICQSSERNYIIYQQNFL